jgi:hypothetical protein
MGLTHSKLGSNATAGVTEALIERFLTRDSPGPLLTVHRPGQWIKPMQVADEAIQNADPWDRLLREVFL